MTDIESRGAFRSPSEVERAVRSVNRHAHQVAGPRDLNQLVDRVSGADCVLLGEASHGASEYYRSMVEGTDDSWNVRDRHMVQTLNRLLDHHGPDACRRPTKSDTAALLKQGASAELSPAATGYRRANWVTIEGKSATYDVACENIHPSTSESERAVSSDPVTI